MGNLNFDASEVAPINMDPDPLPKGRYLAHLVHSEVVPTSRGDGLLLKLAFDILEKGFEGKKAFGQLNIQNPSEKAQQIGRGMLSSLCRACGKTGVVEDSTELHEVPFVLGLGMEESPGYAPKNKITGFYPTKKMEDNKEVLLNNATEAEDLPDFLK